MQNLRGDSSRDKKWLENSKVFGFRLFVCGGFFKI